MMNSERPTENRLTNRALLVVLLAILSQAFESKVLDWSSFYFKADDYPYCFTLEAKKNALTFRGNDSTPA